MNVLALTETAQHLIRSFSWMLIHSIWQGLLLALLTAFLLMINPKASAAKRYSIALSQTVLFLLAAVLTFIIEWNYWHAEPLLPGVKAVNDNLNLASSVINMPRFIQYFTANAPLIVLLWSLVFVYRTLRLINGIMYLRYARQRLIYNPGEEWNNRFNALCRKLGLPRTVQLLESGRVHVPVVIGYLKPVILVPVGMLTGIPVSQVEAVLLHELAHIRRNDYVINVLQTIAETIFFFNPGLLWLSACLRNERENCCDDIALAQTKDKSGFVEALIAFKEYALYGKDFQTAFPGKKNHLLNRVSRIVYGRNPAPAPAEKAVFFSGLILLLAAFAAFAVAKEPVATASHRRVATISAVLSNELTANTAKQTFSAGPNHPKRKSGQERSRKPGTVRKRKIAEMNAQSQVIPQHVLYDTEQELRNRDRQQQDKHQAKLNELQTAKNVEQARLNAEQAKYNAKQRLRNEEQADRNREQARQNEIRARTNAEQLSKQD